MSFNDTNKVLKEEDIYLDTTESSKMLGVSFIQYFIVGFDDTCGGMVCFRVFVELADCPKKF